MICIFVSSAEMEWEQSALMCESGFGSCVRLGWTAKMLSNALVAAIIFWLVAFGIVWPGYLMAIFLSKCYGCRSFRYFLSFGTLTGLAVAMAFFLFFEWPPDPNYISATPDVQIPFSWTRETIFFAIQRGFFWAWQGVLYGASGAMLFWWKSVRPVSAR